MTTTASRPRPSAADSSAGAAPALPDEEPDAYLAGPLAGPSAHTIRNPAALRDELAECRATGIALNYTEHQEEWCGITAAVRDRAGRDLAYVNVTLPTYRWARPQLHVLGPALKGAAAEIEARPHLRRTD